MYNSVLNSSAADEAGSGTGRAQYVEGSVAASSESLSQAPVDSIFKCQRPRWSELGFFHFFHACVHNACWIDNM